MQKNKKVYPRYIKRLLDIVLSIIAIILLSPIYIVVSILVLIFMGWPILFKQPRPGKNEKIFNMYKFRTMTNKKNKEGVLLSDEERINKFGKFLRTTSLDELPELFCILTGKMSIVGPRPLVVSYLPYYNDREKHRHDVKPGLTGLAQINGRNTLQWEERFEYDIEYVNNISFKMDLKIIIYTIKKVFKREDIVLSGTGKIEDFHKYRKKQLEKNNK
ncbi:MAG: sugar transferase [Clostridiales bacterium]|nr:sugar transferase [Clostridiales bacterium]